jgi:serum/glucocorticoid-regulated kinase 2
LDERTLFETIQNEDYSVAKINDTDAVALIHGLLTKDPRKRLGEEGSSEVLAHAWFQGVDLVKLRAKQIVAPWQPKVTNAFDCCCFDDWEGLVDNKLEIDYPKLSRAEENRFKSF